MTIQQHASFDSSAAELNATSKLVKAWESKNAKNAAKAGGISLMALSLAACGGSSTPQADNGGDAGGDAGGDTPDVTPVSLSMTATADALVGTSGDDTFSGLLSGAMGVGSTVQSGDSISGGAGADKATFFISGDAGGAFNLGGIVTTGVETIAVSNYDADAGITTVDMSTMSGVTNVELTNSGANGDTTFDNILNIVDASVKGAGDVALTYSASVVAGSADVQNITVDTYTGGLTAASIETVNLTASGGNSTVASLTATSATKLTISGDKNITLTTDLTTNTGSLKTVDASAATGNVTITSSDATNSTITLGSGADRLVRQNNDDDAGASDSISGGAGVDTLAVTTGANVTAANMVNYSGFERLDLTGANGAAVDLAGVSMFSIIRNSDATAATATVNNVAADTSFEIRAGAADAVLTVTTLADDTLTDSTTVTLGNATAATGVTAAFTGNDYETINLVSTGAANNLIVKGTDLTTLNVSGSAAFNLDTTTAAASLATINASTMTGAFTMDAAEGTAKVAITTGSGGDTVIGGSGANTISTGAGADTITSVEGTDTIDAGAGNDTIVVDDFSDLTSADSIDGGDGTDTLKFSEDANHDLTADATILNGVKNVEKYSFTGINGDTVTINDAIMNNGAITIAFTNANANTFTAAGVLTSTNTVNFSGATGADTYIVGNGIDKASLGSGNDVVTVNTEAYLQATDVLDGGLGSDTFNVVLVGGTVSAVDSLSAATFAGVTGFEIINVDADASTDYISFALTDDVVNANNTSNALAINAQSAAGGAFDGLATIDASAVTSTVALTITGGSGVDTITGGAGADEIIGGGGADVLNGGAGKDDFHVDNGTAMDVITGFDFGTSTTSVDQIQFNATFLGNANGADTTADFTAAAKANDGTASVDTGSIAANIDANTDIAIITNTTYANAAAIDTAVTLLDGSVVTQDFILVYQDTFGNTRMAVVESDGVDDGAASEFVVTDFAQLSGVGISDVASQINSGDFIIA